MSLGTPPRARALILVLAGLAVTGGLLTLIGWAADLPRLADWFGNGISQQPNAALGVVCAGAALLALAARRRGLGLAFATGAALIGGATLAQHLAGADLGIDRLLLWRDWGSQGTVTPGRMGVPASLSLTLLGAGAALAAGPRARGAAAAAALFTAATAWLSITGHAFGADPLFALPRLTAIALQTSLMLLALAFGLLLLLPDVQPTRLLLDDSAAALAMRRALPAVVLLPFALGWLRLLGERHRLYGPAFGTAMLVLALTAALGAVAWWAARAVRRHERAVHEGRTRLQAAVGGMADGFFICNAQWRFDFVNHHLAQRLGLAPAQMLGRGVWDLLPAAVGEQARAPMERAMRERIAVDHELFHESTQRWFHDKAYPTDDGGLAVVSIDITERKRQHLLRDLQQEVLECLVKGASIADCLMPLLEAMPRLSAGLRGCVLLADADGETFAAAVAPPDLRTFADAALGARLGQAPVGSCDPIADDPRWPDAWRALCAAHGIHACHATPVVGSAHGPGAAGKALGSLMLCFAEPHPPDAWELEVARFAAHACALAVERAAREQQLADERAHQRLLIDSLEHATEALQKAAAYAQAQAGELEQLMQTVPVAVWVAHDPGCEVITANAAGHALLRVPSGGVIPLSAPADAPSGCRLLRHGVALALDELPMQRVGRSGRPIVDETLEVAYADGSRRDILLSAVPLLRADGSVRGVLATGIDITERNRAAQALRSSEQRLQLALSIGASATWDLDLDTGLSHWSDSHFALLGLEPTPDRMAGARTWVSAVLAEDLPAVQAEWARAEAEHDVFRSEHRLRRADDGSVLWARAAGQFLYDEAGRAHRFLGVWYEITALKEAERTLHEADRLKDQFLATLAHELRNPLAPLRHSIELLQRDGGRAELRRQALATMDRQVNQLVRLVDDLLDASRINRDRLLLQRVPVTATEIVRHAVEASAPALQAAEVELQTVVPDERLPLHADPARLTQLLCNLLTNACKFTDRGGLVRLVVERRRRQVQITVEDNGVGISAQALPTIFDMFSQVDATRSRAQGGLGIGLALARRLAEMHGGSLTAHSAGLGLGARFTLRLPLAPGVDAAPAVARPRPAQGPVARRRVLVVDDNHDAADSLAAILLLDGHEVRIARDGAQALDTAQAFRPEVVVLDIGLPDIDGYAVCAALRQQPWGREARVVALTGWGQDPDRRRSQEAGFDAHLLKPVDPNALRSVLGLERALSAVEPNHDH